MAEALVHLHREAAVAAGVGAASLPAAVGAGAGDPSCQGWVRPVGVLKAGLPAGRRSWEVGAVVVVAAAGVLLQEPALPKVGDLSLERTQNPREGKGGVKFGAWVVCPAPPHTCALSPRLPSHHHLTTPTTPSLPLPALSAEMSRAPLPDPGSPAPTPPSLKLLRTWAG